MLLNIRDTRKPYNEGTNYFSEDHIKSKDPIDLFASWFNEACKLDQINEANAMCLATSTKDGFPSNRYVLLKEFSREGFTFYTKYTSRKGIELEENPRASLCFYWEPLKRSIRIEGLVKKISVEESTEYFKTRPVASQIVAHVSCLAPKVIENRDCLTNALQKATEEFKNKPVPKPEAWGGYVVVPTQFEFWQGQSDRSHDRITFRKKLPDEVIDPSLTKEGVEGWLMERLSP